jgi:hypothetical protein
MARLMMNHWMYEHSEPVFRESVAEVMSSTGLEELRRDRLFELRAVIESLRLEQHQAPSGTDAVPDWRIRS